MGSSYKITVSLFLLSLLISVSSFAEQVILQGTNQMDDTWLYDGRYLGEGDVVQLQMRTWIKHVLFRFDLSGIPSGLNTMIDSTELRLDIQTVRADHSSIPIDVHFVTKPWNEYGSSWYVYDDPTPSNPGSGDELAWDTPGGDYEAVPAVTLYLPAKNAWEEDSITELTPMIQDWVDGARPNYGLLIKYRVETGGPEDYGFNWGASEWLAHVQPVLTINYHSLVPEPATVMLILAGAIGFILRKKK